MKLLEGWVYVMVNTKSDKTALIAENNIRRIKKTQAAVTASA